MKIFLSVFFAVLCALAVAYFGIRLFERSEAWVNQKAEALADLQTAKTKLASMQEQAKLYPPEADKSVSDTAQMLVKSAAAAVAEDESTLLDFYTHKPLPLSNEEKRQAAEWRRDVGTPR